MNILRFVIIICLISILSCNKNSNLNPAKTFFLYTSLNGYGGNKVVCFEVDGNGFIVNQQAFETNGLGGVDTNRYPPTRGIFASQGGLLIVQDKLIVVNPGSDDISIFSINKSTGSLNFINKFSSHGKRPVSISATQARYNFITNTTLTSDNFYHVLVANQFDYPLILDTGINKIYYPNKTYYQNLHVIEPLRNVSLFLLNAVTGEFQFVKTIESFENSQGGVEQVAFNNSGSQFAMSTNGIPHITSNPLDINLNDIKPSQVVVYNMSQSISNPNPAFNRQTYAEAGICNTVAFYWSPNDKFIYTTNANLVTEKNDNSVTTLQVLPSLKKIQNFSTANDYNVAACWIYVDPILQLVFVSSSNANAISVFKNDLNNGLIPINNAIGNDTYFITLPNNSQDNTELLSLDNFLFTLKSFSDYSILSFQISADGQLTKIDTKPVIQTPIKSKLAYNFLGLKGFKKE